MDHPANRPPWYNTPLPKNWEAKYDPGQKRFFFIDHTTKTTSWEDPRLKLWKDHEKQTHLPSQPQPLPTSSWQHASPHRHHQSSGVHGSDSIAMKELTGWQKDVYDKYGMSMNTAPKEDEELPSTSDLHETAFILSADPEKVRKLTQMFPSATEMQVKRLLAKHKNVEGLTIVDLEKDGHKRQMANAHALLLLKFRQEFPEADDALIKGLIQSADGDEEAVRLQLKELGYKAVEQPPVKTHPAPRASSPLKEAHKVSDKTKRKRVEKLKSEFPDLGEFAVRTALETCHYDESNARNILKTSSQQTAQRLSVGYSSSTHDSVASSSTAPAPELTESSLPCVPDPVFTSEDLDFSSVISKISFDMPPPASPAKSTEPKKKTISHNINRDWVKRSPQETSSAYVSPFRTSAQGPNGSLAQGPNKALLIDNYVHEQGPNKSNRLGPNPNNHKGPSTRKGPDCSMSHGPNRSFCSGPVASARDGPLVTSM